jgi:hypothetical protein
MITLGGKNRPPQVIGTIPTGSEIPGQKAEKATKTVAVLDPATITPYINEQLKRLSDHIAQAARTINILPEAELERNYEKYLATESSRQRPTEWDFTHNLLDAAAPQGEDGIPARNEILRKLIDQGRSPIFQAYASMEIVVPGTYADLSEEQALWKHMLHTGAVILSFSKPSMFCIGTLTPLHMQLSTFVLTKIWEGTKEGNPKPFVSGFNLPHQYWKKLYLEQGARC